LKGEDWGSFIWKSSLLAHWICIDSWSTHSSHKGQGDEKTFRKEKSTFSTFTWILKSSIPHHFRWIIFPPPSDPWFSRNFYYYTPFQFKFKFLSINLHLPLFRCGLRLYFEISGAVGSVLMIWKYFSSTLWTFRYFRFVSVIFFCFKRNFEILVENISWHLLLEFKLEWRNP